MTELDSKLPAVGTTVFTRMSQLAEKYGAINLSQGFPDFDAPEALLAALSDHVRQGHNQYAPMAGLPLLRERVAEKIRTFYRTGVDAERQVSICPGATQALFCAIQAVVRAGDEVIVFDPCYDSYEPAVQLAGGHCIHVPLQSPAFSIDWQCLRTAIGPRTRLLILNTPNNPTGALLSRTDLDRLAELIRDRRVYVLSDEVYEHLVYDGKSHVSVLSHEELFQRSFVVSSFGKTYHVTGWKTGYIVATEALMREWRKIHQYVSFCAVTPMQYALADFMASHPAHLHALPDFYQAKRDLFCRLLAGSRFNLTPTSGTYFQLADYSAIRNDLDDNTLCEWLVREHGVAAIPLSAFYRSPPPDSRLIRFCFAKREETLQQAAEKLLAV